MHLYGKNIQNFKRLLFWSLWANFAQISYGASLGWGNERLLKWSRFIDQDGHYAHVWLNPLKNLGAESLLKPSGTGSTKVTKIMVVKVCFPMHLYGKKHLKILFSTTEDALWLNLCIYYWEHLHVCSGYVTQVSEPWPVGLLFFYCMLFVTEECTSHFGAQSLAILIYLAIKK